jgi:Flp pilus assembly protein TadD
MLWNQRGWCLNMLGDFPAALTALRRASELDDKSPNIWGNLSFAYNQMGDYENGRVFGERALQFDPNHMQSLSNLGRHCST